MGDMWDPVTGAVPKERKTYVAPNINWHEIGRMRFLGLSIDC
jgi:hypothetical protein